MSDVLDVAQDAEITSFFSAYDYAGFTLSSGFKVKIQGIVEGVDAKTVVMIEGPIIDRVDLARLTR